MRGRLRHPHVGPPGEPGTRWMVFWDEAASYSFIDEQSVEPIPAVDRLGELADD